MDEFTNTENLHRTVSHEVAHGAFVLYHTFSEFPALQQATTDNLMDYATGTHLCKYQWDLIHDPVWLIVGGGSEEEGAMMKDEDTQLSELLLYIRRAYQRNKKLVFAENLDLKAEDIRLGETVYSEIRITTPSGIHDVNIYHWRHKTDNNNNILGFRMVDNSNDEHMSIYTTDKFFKLQSYLFPFDITTSNATNEAISIVDVAANSGSSPFFPLISGNDFYQGVKNRIENPLLIAQKSSPLCGMAAVAHLFAIYDPIGYAKVCVGLYKSGRAIWNRVELNVPEQLSTINPSYYNMSPIDFVLLSTMRDNKNIDKYPVKKKHNYIPNWLEDLQNNGAGISWTWDIDYYMLNLVGMREVLSISRYGKNDYAKKNLDLAQNNYDNDGATILLLDHEILKGIKPFVPFPTHYVVFKGQNTSIYDFNYWHRGNKKLNNFNYSKNLLEIGVFLYFHYK